MDLLTTKYSLGQKIWDKSMEDLPTFLWGIPGVSKGLVFTMNEHASLTESPKQRFPDRPYLRTLVDAWTQEELLLILKSRQMLVTWVFAAAYVWRCLHEGRRVLAVCKKESAADANLERMWYIFNQLPDPFKPKATRKQALITFEHRDGNSSIQAASQTTDDARQFTFSDIWVDEAAFTPNFAEIHGASMATIKGGGRFLATSTPNGKEHMFKLAVDGGRILFSDVSRPFDAEVSVSSNVNNIGYEPSIIAPGMKAWRGLNGYATILCHYTADPLGAQEAVRRVGTLESDFQRENNLDFTSFAGKPVYGSVYQPQIHEDSQIFYNPDLPLWVGWDFGYHRPAVHFSQFHPDGGWWLLGEILGEDQTLPRFVEDNYFPYLHLNFPKKDGQETQLIIHAADPAGNQVTDKSEHTSFTILGTYGIFPRAKKTEINEGLTLISSSLGRQVMGKPGLKVNPVDCPITTDAFRGGYRYPEATAAVPEPRLPEKDGFYEHVMDTTRYVAVHALRLWTPKDKKVEELTFAEKIRRNRTKMQDDDYALPW